MIEPKFWLIINNSSIIKFSNREELDTYLKTLDYSSNMLIEIISGFTLYKCQYGE